MVVNEIDKRYSSEHGKEIIDAMREYRRLTGEGWKPFDYDGRYDSVAEWHKALLQALAQAKKE